MISRAFCPIPNEDYKVLDKTQVKLFPNLTSIPFEYLYISWVTSYVSNVGFLDAYPGRYRSRTPLPLMFRA